MYFFSKYLYGTSSIVVVEKLQHFVSMLLPNQSFSWGSFFLPNLYKGMHSLFEQIHEDKWYKKTQGPIWFWPLWAQLYLKDFIPNNFRSCSPPSDAKVLATKLVATPIKDTESLDRVEKLFNFTLIAFEWCPALEREIGPKWIIHTS